MNSRLLGWSLVTVLCLGVSDQTTAQPTKLVERPDAPAEEGAGKRSMILLIKTEHLVNTPEFMKKLKAAIESCGGCSNLEKLELKRMSQFEYEAIDRFIRGFAPGQGQEADKKLRARLVMIGKPVLIIPKDDPTDDLLSLEVLYHDGKKETFKPKPSGTAGAPLQWARNRGFLTASG